MILFFIVIDFAIYADGNTLFMPGDTLDDVLESLENALSTFLSNFQIFRGMQTLIKAIYL